MTLTLKSVTTLQFTILSKSDKMRRHNVVHHRENTKKYLEQTYFIHENEQVQQRKLPIRKTARRKIYLGPTIHGNALIARNERRVKISQRFLD